MTVEIKFKADSSSSHFKCDMNVKLGNKNVSNVNISTSTSHSLVKIDNDKHVSIENLNILHKVSELLNQLK